MGLDMYLYKDTYVGAYFEHRNVTGTVELMAGDEVIPVNTKRISSIREQVAYWRKANAVHHWFVENCQDGVDECQHSSVSYDQLKELLGICETIKAHPERASELLPTQSGFFFGDTEYDEWYYEDIDLTIRQLSAIVEECKDERWPEFVYHSSW